VSSLHAETIRPGRDDGKLILRVVNLSVRVGIRRVIEDVSLEIVEGAAITLTGANGSGKSTLLNAIAGLEPARVESGRIELAGNDVTQLPAHERARRGLAYMRQRGSIFEDLTVAENLEVAIGGEGPARFAAAHPEWARDLPSEKRAALLSGGQKQRLAWAMATLRPSRLLLADEPETGLSAMPPLPPDLTILWVTHPSPTDGRREGENP
jgi:ABC-type branched-subunit amino acid transport system ATPase component